MKVRQPLREAVVVAADRERGAIEGLEALLQDELNVKSVRYVSEADELGPLRAEAELPRARPSLRQADAAGGRRHRRARPARGSRAGERVGINFNGQEHEIGPDDVTLVLQPLDGYQVERSGTHAVALNLELDDELRREGLAREVVHAVQAARKNAGLDVEDRIALTLGGDDELLAAARAHEDYVAGETLATSLTFDGAQGEAESTEIEGRRAVDLG